MTGRPPRVVLWDIDGTLVSAGGAGRRAFERAVADFVGPFDGALRDMRLDGMTDRLIVREALALLGKPHSDALCDELLGRYVDHLRGEIHGPGFRVLPAVAETLALLRDSGRPFGLCTGNVAEGARVKLTQGGLDHFFEWGDGAIAGFAAHHHGCPVLAVATGRFDVQALRAAGAEWAVATLDAPEARALLLGA